MNEYAPGKSPIIKNLIPGLTERGKIKIGMKGEKRQKSGGPGFFQLPTKLDHFVITTLERDQTGNFMQDKELHKMLEVNGNSPIKRIPVRLLFNDIELNFQCRYTLFYGRTLACSGDGQFAHRLDANKKRVQVECPCRKQDPDYNGENNDGKGKCKINGCLSVLIDGANCVGGIWKFRTTGYNSTVGILSSLTLIKGLTGGILAGIPLAMTIQPKVATSPTDGAAVTIYVVGIEYAGSIQDLKNGALKIAQDNALFIERLANVAQEARRLISVDAEVLDQAGDIVDEFHPEQQPAPAMAEPTAQKPPETETTHTTAEDKPPETQEKPKRGRRKNTETPPQDQQSQAKEFKNTTVTEPEPSQLQAPENFNLFDMEE